MIVNPNKDARYCKFCGEEMTEWRQSGTWVRYACGTRRWEWQHYVGNGNYSTQRATKRSKACRRGEVARLAERVAALEARQDGPPADSIPEEVPEAGDESD